LSGEIEAWIELVMIKLQACKNNFNLKTHQVRVKNLLFNLFLELKEGIISKQILGT